MTEPGLALVLGFIGLDPVHKDNSRAMLNDLITSFKKTVKKPQVLFLLDAEGWSTTMAELCDFAMTSGFGIGLVGPSEYIDDKGQDRLNAADGNIYRLKDDQDIAAGMVNALSVWPNGRLIIIGDPEEDDDVYTAVELALAKGIKVRTLLHGLDEVTLEEEPDNTEDEETDVAGKRRQVEDEDEYDEDDVEDADVDYDDEALAEDDDDEDEDEDVVEAEIVDEDDEDDEEDEVSARRRKKAARVVDEDDEDEDEIDDEDADDDDSDQSDSEEEEDDEEEEEPVATEAKETKWTTAKLERLYEQDRNQFKEVAASYDILPGRGIKSFMMIERIMDAVKAGKAPKKVPATKAAAPAKKAPAKKAAAPAKKAPAKAPAPTKKVAAPTKAAAVKKTAPVRTVAPAATNGHVDKVLLKAALAASKKFTELAESLL